MVVWSSHTLVQDGQTEWLVHLYEKTINGIRDLDGLPSEEEGGILTVNIPLMSKMAEVMRHRQQLPPGHNIPSGVVDQI